MEKKKNVVNVTASIWRLAYVCLLKEARRVNLSISALVSKIICERYGLSDAPVRKPRGLNQALLEYAEEAPRPLSKDEAEYFHHLFYEGNFPGLRKHYLEHTYEDDIDWQAQKICFDELKVQQLQMLTYKPDMADQINAFFIEWENKLNTEKPKGVK